MIPKPFDDRGLAEFIHGVDRVTTRLRRHGGQPRRIASGASGSNRIADRRPQFAKESPQVVWCCFSYHRGRELQDMAA